MSRPAPEIAGSILFNEPMARHTSFRIGGPADILARPASEADVVEAVRWAAEAGLPVTVLGNGTNVLVSDRGIRGLTILLGRALNTIDIEGTQVRAGAGAPLMKVAIRAARAGLSGMEFAEGIPGTLGGAIFMNAGTLLGEVKDCLTNVEAVSLAGERLTLSVDALGLAYRCSSLSRTRHILLAAQFQLRAGGADEISATMERLRKRRHTTQPHWDRSAGCVFKNPEGHSAGRLLDEAGAKGMEVGAAQVSPVHANFVINNGAARAEDVVALMHQMRQRIEEKHGLRLIPEIEFVGDWSTPPFPDAETVEETERVR